MLIAAIVLTSATGPICGLASALESVRPRLLDSVRDGGHGAPSFLTQWSARNVWSLTNSLGPIRLELNRIHLDQTVTEVSPDSLVCSP
jgi:hypothetical protein